MVGSVPTGNPDVRFRVACSDVTCGPSGIGDAMSDTTTTGSTVRETAPLGAQWPTIDPFLFCAHHDDAYPHGDERMAAGAALEGRDIGLGVPAGRGAHGARRVAQASRHRLGIRRRRRLEHVPRLGGAGIPATPAPRLR